jgi:hypothetical protein
MALKYSDKPVLNYGGFNSSKFDAVAGRFPNNARPISEAPTATSTPITVYEADGRGQRALFYRGNWMRVVTERDRYSGGTITRMDGVSIRNPIMWSS